VTVELAALLERAYGLVADSIEVGERGTVAQTWVVRSRDAQRFVKLIPESRYSVNLEAGLPVQLALRDAGITEVPRPITSVDGRLSIRTDGALLAVYEYVNARHTRDFPLEALVDLIGRVHGAQLGVAVPPETFGDATTDRLEAAIGDLLAGSWSDPHRPSVVRELGPIEGELRSDIAAYRELVEELRAGADGERVITHGDAPWNVMVARSGGIFLVDWDDVLLAPRERDSWFHLLDRHEAAQFLARYRLVFRDYRVDERFFAYYLLRRYAEDLEWIFENLLSSKADADLERFAGYFQGTLAWLREPIRRLPSR
jgi:spectinomycin phosphotransferase